MENALLEREKKEMRRKKVPLFCEFLFSLHHRIFLLEKTVFERKIAHIAQRIPVEFSYLSGVIYRISLLN